MSDIIESLVEDYQQKLEAEKQNLQKLEEAKSISIRNIDRIEGALVGVKDAQSKLLSSAAAESEVNPENTEVTEAEAQ
tara:strand:- start:107 stop:340 length:234 start_codon:yes stop_codon:yes gene_type:complete